MYKISVVIPTVGENTLSNVLEALNNSTIKPFEVILSIHEDNFDLVKDYKLDNLKIVLNKFGSQVTQRIKGFNESKGDYILQLDSDIVLENDTIEILLNNINLLGDKVAIAPVLKSTKNIVYPKQNMFNIFFRKILNIIMDGKSHLYPGKITKSSIETLPPSNDNILNNIETEWLPGGCILHRKQNLISFNYYNHSGKAFCEDLFHSFYLTKSEIKLFINKNAIVNHIDNSIDNYQSFFDLYRYFSKIYKVRIDFLKLINGNKIRFYIWFIYFTIKNTIFYFFKSKNELY